MGQTRVDLLHLLEDLRDAYPGSLEEVILTEILANSLDSGASRIVLSADPAQAALAIVDDGAGMKRRELARYHDVAASRKTRGEGIGFAGIGIKLGLLASEEVVTETRRGPVHVATRWGIASRHRAPWKWISPLGLVGEKGTAVCLRLRNPLSPLLDAGFLEATLRSHFRPLLDSDFAEILEPQYPRGISFSVNGRALRPEARAGLESAPIRLRVARARKTSAAGEVWRSTNGAPLPEGLQGIAVSTFGKVIKRGWEWLGLFPARPEQSGGLIEAPALAQSLTLNKADFIRVGAKGAVYLVFRKAIQQAVGAQLSQWGDLPPDAERRDRRSRVLERDIESVLAHLSEEFPLLQSLVERHAGGQTKLPVGRPEARPEATLLAVAPPAAGPAASAEGAGEASPGGGPERGAEPPPIAEIRDVPVSARPLGRRPGRYGLALKFESRPESPELARLAESTIWINEANPAYRRAAASRSDGYHAALGTALALAEVAVEPADARHFVNAFLSRWGEAVAAPRGRGRRRAGRPAVKEAR
jgi:hypothetical protein